VFHHSRCLFCFTKNILVFSKETNVSTWYYSESLLGFAHCSSACVFWIVVFRFHLPQRCVSWMYCHVVVS
jgi:hypothetical protein